MPITAVPKQNSAKLPRHSASAHVAAPATAMAEPVMNPRRRPTLAIHNAAGIAANADPRTKVVAPSVANALFSTSA
jgi:hypothetical protein